MGVGAVLVAVALERTDPVTVAIITAMMPVIGISLECFLDGRRLTLHVGGGITWRSDPAAEWEETRAKARGPLQAIGASVQGEEER